MQAMYYYNFVLLNYSELLELVVCFVHNTLRSTMHGQFMCYSMHTRVVRDMLVFETFFGRLDGKSNN